uniref:Uncharacterized protein n=1 Tax=Leersia perrieri TaxID=77586 RepID=A0A0D9VMJ6_9ORYZ
MVQYKVTSLKFLDHAFISQIFVQLNQYVLFAPRMIPDLGNPKPAWVHLEILVMLPVVLGSHSASRSSWRGTCCVLLLATAAFFGSVRGQYKKPLTLAKCTKPCSFFFPVPNKNKGTSSCS